MVAMKIPALVGPLVLAVSLFELFGIRSAPAANYSEYVKPLNERKLAIDYEVEKSEFVVGEPIFIQYWVMNNSSEIQYFKSPDVARFDVLTEDEEKLPHTLGTLDVTYYHPPFVPGVGDGVYKAIQPGSRAQLLTTEVLSVYGKGMVFGGAYLPTGKYRVHSRELPSDTVEFKIVWPEDTASAQACRLLVSLVEDDDRRRQLNEIESVHHRIVEQFPNSALVPSSLAILTGFRNSDSPHGDPRVIQGYVRRLIVEFPTHRYALKYLSSLDPSMVSDVQRPVIIRNLRQMLSTEIDTLYQNRINEMLRRLE